MPKRGFIIAITTVIFLLLAHIYGLMMITAVIIPVLLHASSIKKASSAKRTVRKTSKRKVT